MDLKTTSHALRTHAGNPSFGFAALCHLAFAFVVFSPFFLSARLLVGSTDNMYTTFPNMLTNHRTFNGGGWGLWNPYILGGVDFSSSTQNFIYSPLNWPLFAFPEKYLFFLLTLRMFVEVWLVGVFGYLLFREEFSGNRKWALFSSTVYQLSGYMFFSITTYANLTIYLFSTIALYAVWTLGKRRDYLSYIYLALSTALVILCGNMVYSFGAILMLIVLFIYREWPASLVAPLSLRCVTFYGGVLTGVLMAMVRLLPFALAIPHGDRMSVGDFFSFVEGPIHSAYLGITAFVPEVFGVNYNASMPLLSKINPALEGAHTHVLGFTYFGTLPALLVLFAFLCMRERRFRFWITYLLAASLWFLRVRPASDIIDLLFYPLRHAIVAKIMIPVGVAMASGLAGIYLEENCEKIDGRHLKMLAIAAALVLSSVLIVHVYSLPAIIGAARFAVILLPALTFGGIYLFRPAAKGGIAFAVLIPLGGFFFLAAKGPWPDLAPDLAKDRLFFSSLVYIAISIAATAFLLVFSSNLSAAAERRQTIPSISAFALAPLALALFYPFGPMGMDMTANGVRILALLGSLRFMLVFIFFAWMVRGVKSRGVAPSLIFPLFFLVLISDLLPFNKEYSRQVSEPFLKAGELYPDRNYILNPAEELLLTAGTKGCNNLLKNDSFESWSGADAAPPDGWALGGPGPTVREDPSQKVLGRYSAAITYGSGDVTNLYQDIGDRGDFSGRTFTFGAWVRATKPHHSVLLLTDSQNGTFSIYHTGRGGWEWLTATHTVEVSSGFVRPHISVTSPGTVYADGASLVEAPYLPPFYCNPVDAEHERSPDFQDSTMLAQYWGKGMDTKNFRVNNPHILLKLSGGEIQTNMPSLYGVRSYGGVNSLVEGRYKGFATNFALPNGGPGALTADMNDPRYLDLMGVRYDVDDEGGMTFRPNALSRFMLFEDFVVERDEKRTLGMLKDRGFNPQQTLILAEDPGFPPAGPKGGARGAEFVEKDSSAIEVNVGNDMPSALFFNDSYNRGWKAYVNGKPLPVIRADYNFMAVGLGPGENHVVFRFEPAPFHYGAYATAWGIALFLFSAVSLFIFSGPGKTAGGKRQEKRKNGASDENTL